MITDKDKLQENKTDHQSYMHWKAQIADAESWRAPYVAKADNIVERYRDEDRDVESQRRYNILYSNTETLLPVIYSSPPKADVRARDSKSIAHRKGASMMESALNYYVESGGLHDAANQTVMDFLLSGTGQIRPCYKSIEAKEDITLEDGTVESEERVVFEEIKFDYVHWRDFIYPECARWEDLPWIAFKTRMAFEEAAEMFGAEKAGLLSYEPMSGAAGADKAKDSVKKACVYEIWDKRNKQQVFYAETASSSLLDVSEDPLELDDFYPVPKPLLSITTSGTLLPVPLYLMYQDQALELDEVNSRICLLIENMKRRGFYDSSIAEFGNLENMGDNEFWPVKNWSEYAAKGGMQGCMDIEDISAYANILQILTEHRRQILEDIYQIIGVSDIRRGQTDPRETLGAQKLKGRYGTIRISTYQRKVALFMRDLLKIAGEIIINQFDAETLSVITNLPVKTESKMVETSSGEQKSEIIVGTEDLLHSLGSKSPSDILIDIESDSTVIEDTEEDIYMAKEAIGAITEFTNIAPSLVQGIGLEATSELLLQIIRKFKMGREIHQQVMDHVDKLIRDGVPQQPTPEEILANADLEKKKMDNKMKVMEMMFDAQIKRGEMAIKQQANMLKAEELGIRAEVEKEKINLDALDKMIKVQALEAEAANPDDNAVVGA